MKPSEECQKVIHVLSTVLLAPVRVETDLQRAVAEALERAGIRYAKEVKLGPGMRIDFVVMSDLNPNSVVRRNEAHLMEPRGSWPTRVGIECKKGYVYGPLLGEQLWKYKYSGKVDEVVVFSERKVNMRGVAGVENAPFHFVISRNNWGMAV